MSLAIPQTQGRFHIEFNVEYVHKDAHGNVKQLFVENKLGTAILRLFRHFNPNPIDGDGQVKEGLLNYLSAYGLRIPYITGRWSSKRKISNLITTVGKALVAGRINGSGAPAAATYIAVGTGATAADVADTDLDAEIVDSGLERANSAVSLVTTDTANDSARLSNTFTVTGTKAIVESGVFNAAVAGTMLARQVFSTVNVVNGDSFQVTWTFDVD